MEDLDPVFAPQMPVIYIPGLVGSLSVEAYQGSSDGSSWTSTHVGVSYYPTVATAAHSPAMLETADNGQSTFLR
jgi:hypothetical protein